MRSLTIFLPLFFVLVSYTPFTLGDGEDLEEYNDVAVRTNSGTVWGRAKEYVGQNQEVAGEYYSFRGIPYAEAPLDDLMWKDPVPVAPWNEEIDASKEEVPVCLQPGYFFGKMNETAGDLDCLFLSIYTTDLPSVTPDADLKPVFFWIHGGGFVMGSGDMG